MGADEHPETGYENALSKYGRGLITIGEHINMVLDVLRPNEAVNARTYFPPLAFTIAEHFKLELPTRNGSHINRWMRILTILAGTYRRNNDKLPTEMDVTLEQELGKAICVVLEPDTPFTVEDRIPATVYVSIFAPVGIWYDWDIPAGLQLCTYGEVLGYDTDVDCVPIEYAKWEEILIPAESRALKEYTGYYASISVKDFRAHCRIDDDIDS